jgi:hypothetical protein
MFRYGVMRVARAALAVACGLAFVVVCLGACLGGAAGEHACCKESDGLTAADAKATDCCTVVSGVRSDVTTNVATTAADVATWVPQLAALPRLPLNVSVVPVASSPPLVLRI